MERGNPGAAWAGCEVCFRLGYFFFAPDADAGQRRSNSPEGAKPEHAASAENGEQSAAHPTEVGTVLVYPGYSLVVCLVTFHLRSKPLFQLLSFLWFRWKSSNN